MTDYSERTEELIAAAAAEDLSAQEQAELDVLRDQDPSIDSTLAELNSLLPQLRASHWEEAEPPARLAEAVSRLSAEQHGFGGPNNGGPMNAVAPNDVAPAAEPILADASTPPAAPQQRQTALQTVSLRPGRSGERECRSGRNSCGPVCERFPARWAPRDLRCDGRHQLQR